MTVFDKYAKYYDLLYQNKDYESESRFVASLLRKHASGAAEILELGCGTGSHAFRLAEDGFSVHGIDVSEAMLMRANERVRQAPMSVRNRLSFAQGDVRTYRGGRSFDAVISLFHVVSYQSTNEELYAMFDTVARHLGAGGVFVFDYWFAPAVLTQQPTVRVRRIESDEIEVTRIAEPSLDAKRSWVDVNYDVFIRDKKDDSVVCIKETHRMRYLLPSEVEMLADRTGMRVVESCELVTGRVPGLETWGVCAVLARVSPLF